MARGEKGTKRRDTIVDEATRLFAERGYAGASMADLAERVGLRKASLFHHFPSKELLYAAVLERPVKDFGEAVQHALSETNRSFEDRLDGLTRAVVDTMGTQPYAARLLVREAMRWTADEVSPLAVAVASVMEAATTFVQEGQKQGAVPSGDAREIIVSLLGIQVMPFTLPGLIGRFTGGDPFSRTSIERRQEAARVHVRGMILRR